MDKLTDYEKKIFQLIESKLKVGKWYSIDPNREDFKELVSAIQKFHEVWGLIEFFDDSKLKYRIVLRPNMVKGMICQDLGVKDYVESNEIPKTTKDTTSIQRVFKKDENRSDNWIIPMFNSRPDLGAKILAKEEEMRKLKIKENKVDKEKIDKLKKWRNS